MARGSVKRVELKSGAVRWQATYDVGGAGRRRQEVRRFATKREAEAHLNRVLHDPVAASKEPLGAYLERWLRSRLGAGEIRPTTYHTYLSEARRYLAPLWATPLGKLTHRAIQQVFSQAGVAPATLGGARNVLHKALGELVRHKELPANPADGVRLGKAAARKPAFWTGPEMARFLAATADDEWGVVWLTLARTLVRVGELVALRWGDVDLAAGTLTVNRTATRDAAGRRAFGPPKSASGVRVIPLGPSLVAALRAHRVRQLERRLFLGGARADDAQLLGDGAGFEDALLAAEAHRGLARPLAGERAAGEALDQARLEGVVDAPGQPAGVVLDVGDFGGGHASSDETRDTHRIYDETGRRGRPRRSRFWHDEGLVFDRGDGRPLAHGTVLAALGRAAAAAGLPRITPHGFRHSGGSYLVNVERVPVKVVSTLMGHANTAITLDLYTHADAATTRAAVEALERAARSSGAD